LYVDTNDTEIISKFSISVFWLVIPDITLNAIREATNKAWVLGDNNFKRRVEKKLNRQVESSGHGGDRKSGHYQNNQRV